MPPTFQLTMKTGPQPGKIYPLTKGEMIVGRDAAADVVIPDAEVSRKHARLFLQGGGYVLEDLGSTNGSFVDGQRLMGPHSLRAGEMVMFGENISLTFEMINSDPEATIVGAAPVLDNATAMVSEPVIPPSFSVPEPVPAPTYSIPEPEPAPSYSIPTPNPEPSYSSSASSAPMGSAPAAPKKNNTRTWILAGCGCLLLVLCVCGGLAWYISSSGILCSMGGIC